MLVDPFQQIPAMERLAAAPALRLSMGRAAAAAVYPEYDESTMVAKLADLYRHVLGLQKEVAGNGTPCD